jgi:hypothetical protein
MGMDEPQGCEDTRINAGTFPSQDVKASMRLFLHLRHRKSGI